MAFLKQSSDIWMRTVSFAGLLRILHLIAEYPAGLRVYELDKEIKERGVYLTREGSVPSKTTLYHCRNTLLHLRALLRIDQRLLVNRDDPYIQNLLNDSSPVEATLSTVAREAFSALVLQNSDCRTKFFDLFMPSIAYDLQFFRTIGRSVTWRRTQEEGDSPKVLFENDEKQTLLTLCSHSEVNSVLYGVRYWAREELHLIDEFFREDRGSIMYPVLNPNGDSDFFDIVGEIISRCDEDREWTIMSLQDLTVYCCEQRRRPLKSLFAAVQWLYKKYSGQIVLIPTSRSFATLTARSQQQEDFELRSYYRDMEGRYISHIRLHSSIGRLNHVYTS